MRIIKKLYLLSILVFIAACSSAVNQNVKAKHTETNPIFEKVLNSPPAPAEARVVGTRIDAFFASLDAADQEYLKQITALNWGDVYNYKALNQSKKLPALRKINQKTKKLSVDVFNKREGLYLKFIKDLEELATKSIFAEAMLFEFKQKYNAEETGFLEFEKGMSSSTYTKIDLIDEKLAMLSKAPGKYEILVTGEVKFFQDQKGLELMNNYVENNKIHNQLTAKQRLLAQYFINNKQNIVKRFHELSHQ